VTIEEKIAKLERSVGGLLAEIENLPADVLYREPSHGEWAVMSTLAHLAELMPYWAKQAASIAASPGKSFGRTHDDPARLGAIEQHGHDSLDTMVPRIRTAMLECEATLRQIPEGAWSSTGQHPRRGAMSAEQVVDDFIVSHAEEHASQIAATLQSIASHATSRTSVGNT
jgi:uncharacterized damage-inducible protein DinB